MPTRPSGWLTGCLLLGTVLPLPGADIDPAKAGASTNGFRPLVKDDRPSTPVLAPASPEGEIRLKQFKLAPGLKVDLWAAEPMLANPVAFSVDEKGRVFTSETYRYRTSVLDIRHYMFMLEDDLASRGIEDRLAQIRKWFGPGGEKALSNETEVIRLLEDTNGDHRADRSSVFADGFTSPLSGIASGVLARNGEVWFTEIPSLWKFRPATTSEAATMERDKTSLTVSRTPAPKEAVLRSLPHVHGKNLVAEELLRGFGVRFSFTGHDLHGLKFGPDGRLYFSCGDRGAHLVTQEGTVIDLPDEGAVFRCEPDGSKLEVVHRGLRNPQELVFNEYGDLFTGDNDSDQGDRERWVQVVEGGDSGWRVGHQHAPLGNAGLWNMERLWVPHFWDQAAYLVPPIANIGDGPSGLVYDYGTSLPEELKGRFLLAYFKGTSARSGLYSLKLRPAGASYVLVAHDEFVWNSLVPDVDLAPDGSIFFADWHEGWPKSNKGRLYRAYFPGVIADPVVQETAKLLGEGMAKRGEKELLGLLAHRDMRVRQEAQFELAARGPKSFDGLKKVAFESKNQLARLHAIRSLAQMGRKTPTTQLAAEFESLVPLWEETDPQVRVEAARLFAEALIFHAIQQPVYRSAADHLKGEASGYRDPLYQLAKGDPSPAVRRAALDAIGRFAGAFHRASYRRTRHPAQQVRDALKDGAPQSSQGGLPNQFVNPGAEIAEALSKHPVDPVLLNAAANALASVEASLHSGLGRFTSSADRTLRLVGLLAQRRLADQEVAKSLSDPDPLLILEAARAIHDVPITNALPALAGLGDPGKLDPLLKQFTAGRPDPMRAPAPGVIRDVRADQPLPWTNAPMDHLTPMLLRVVNANFRVGTAETAQRLADLATRADLPELIRAEALFALGTWPQPPARDRLVGVYRPQPERDARPAREALQPRLASLLAGSPEAVQLAAIDAAARLRMSEARPGLVAVVRDTGAPAQARAAALRAIAQLETPKPELEALLAFASRDSAEPLRLAASRLGAELNPNDAAGQLTAKLTSGSLAEQQSAFNSLGDLKSDAADAILVEWLDKLMKREVANEVVLDLVEAAAKREAAAVKSRLAAYEEAKLPKDHLSPYREALAGGDAARGRKIFYENASVACTRCHQIGADGGGNAGPPLAGLASRATREHLLESIIFPNRQIAAGFETALLTLKDGRSFAGVVKSETPAELVLLSPEDGEVRLAPADVKSREKGLSGMPEGFGSLLTRTELRDVVEFLGTLK